LNRKIIIGILGALLLVSLVVFCSTLRIGLSFDSDGNVKDNGTFTITFNGSEQYTDEELAEYLFETDMSANPFVFWWMDKFGEHVEIPFIEKYDVELEGLTSFNVTFYDKSIVGYIEYMGSYKYFDKDGIVVESSPVLLPDIPYITGINVDYIVLHEKLPVNNEKLFDILLDVTQLISKYDIAVEKINISEKLEIKLYIGNVRVELGDGDDLSEKMMVLKDIIPQLVDVSGVLDMKVYDPQRNEYTFKKDE